MTTNHYFEVASNRERLHFRLLFVSRSKFDLNWLSLTHTHPFTEIFYVIKGKGSFTNSKHVFDVKQGDIVIVNPYVEHTEVSSEENPLEYITIGIQGISFTDQSQNHRPFIYHNFRDKQQEVLQYLNTIIHEIQIKSPRYEIVCYSFLDILITMLLRQFKLQLKVEEYSTNLGTEIALAKKFIDQNFKKNITLDILADVTHLNKFYLAHSFKNEVGRSPIDYLNYKRVEEAKMLLKTTNLSISQIANIIGFSSQSYFSETFKRYEKMAPSKFRKTMQETVSQ